MVHHRNKKTMDLGGAFHDGKTNKEEGKKICGEKQKIDINIMGKDKDKDKADIMVEQGTVKEQIRAAGEMTLLKEY
eukprot:3190579-Ditylum_brightwellii.AAC.1